MAWEVFDVPFHAFPGCATRGSSCPRPWQLTNLICTVNSSRLHGLRTNDLNVILVNTRNKGQHVLPRLFDFCWGLG